MTASPRPSGTVDYGYGDGASGLEVVGPQHREQYRYQQQQRERGWEAKGAGGVVAEMDAGHVRRGGGEAVEEEEEIFMSSTAYPGQEWAPSNYGHWEED